MIITQEAKDFADTLMDDLATMFDGDPEKMKRFWKEVKLAMKERDL